MQDMVIRPMKLEHYYNWIRYWEQKIYIDMLFKLAGAVMKSGYLKFLLKNISKAPWKIVW